MGDDRYYIAIEQFLYKEAVIPVTSVDIDTDMLRLAKSSYGVRTNREAINLALRDVVMRRRQLDAITVISQIPLDQDPTTIEHGD